MTVSTNATLDYTRDQLITAAYRLAGVWPSSQESSDAQSADDVGMAADFMNLELMNLQAEGVVLRTVERPTPLVLVSGTSVYTLAADTIDVELGPYGEAGMIVNTDNAESMVMAMPRAEWLDNTNKTNVGTPTRVYIERLASVTLTFDPIPNDSTQTFRYARVRLLRDMDSGSVTADLARRWLQYVVYAVATQVALAKNLDLAKVGYLRKEAMRMKERLMADDVQRGPIRMRVVHNSRRW